MPYILLAAVTNNSANVTVDCVNVDGASEAVTVMLITKQKDL